MGPWHHAQWLLFLGAGQKVCAHASNMPRNSGSRVVRGN